MIKVIGIAGYARCGKDTFVGIAKNILTKNKYAPMRVAFADKLKLETQKMLREHGFSASVYTEEAEAKKLIRPLLVWWGCQRRYESEGGLYWVNRVDDGLREITKDMIKNGANPERVVALISDVRFVNEAKWVHDQWGGRVIHLKRYSIIHSPQYDPITDERDGYRLKKEYDSAPNDEEKKNDPLVQELADLRIEWESKKKLTSAEAIEDPYLQGVTLDALNRTGFFSETLSL